MGDFYLIRDCNGNCASCCATKALVCSARNLTGSHTLCLVHAFITNTHSLFFFLSEVHIHVNERIPYIVNQEIFILKNVFLGHQRL